MLLKYGIPLLAVALFTVAIYHVIDTYPATPSASPPIAPAQSPFPQTLAATGIVEPRSEQVAVAAPAPGIVAEVFAQVGHQVSTGAPLFRLDDRSPQSELKVREARLATAKAQLAKLQQMPRADEVAASAARVKEAKANLAVQESRWERGKTLLKDKLISAPEVEQLQEGVTAAKEQLARAEAEDRMVRAGAWEADKAIAGAAVAEAEALVAQGKAELNRLTVTAPVSGTILQVNVRAGEAVGGRPDLPPVVLGDTHIMNLRVEIAEEQISAWRAGLPARAVPRGQSQPQVPLRFVREDPVIVGRRNLNGDPAERSDTRVLQVIYEFDPGKAGVRVGQRMDVFIAVEPN
jgi:multidrug resistance efflux pump